MSVSEYVLRALQKKYTINKDLDVETLNYFESGFVDSLGIIQFIIQIEEEFGISFSDEELADPSFQVVGKLIKLIERKVNENG